MKAIVLLSILLGNFFFVNEENATISLDKLHEKGAVTIIVTNGFKKCNDCYKSLFPLFGKIYNREFNLYVLSEYNPISIGRNKIIEDFNFMIQDYTFIKPKHIFDQKGNPFYEHYNLERSPAVIVIRGNNLKIFTNNELFTSNGSVKKSKIWSYIKGKTKE